MNKETTSNVPALTEAFTLFTQSSDALAAAFKLLDSHLEALRKELAKYGVEGQCASNNLADVIKALPAGIIVLNQEGYVIHCNPAAEELLGMKLTGRLWRDAILQIVKPQPGDGHDVSLATGKIVNISTNPLVSGAGQIIQITDVTKTRDLQHKVNRYERLTAMGEMAANLAHQIRTPLASSMLYLSQLKSACNNSGPQQRLIGKVIARIRHMEYMVRDILIFAHGGYIGDERFAIDDLLHELQTAMEPHFVENMVQFLINKEIANARLQGNIELLASALQNILMNSIQAVGEGGKISLTIHNNKEGLLDFSITDSGPGVPTELQEQIFDPYFTTRRQGTGLGLAVVRVIAQAHGGEVWCERSENQGSQFIMRLPYEQSTGNTNKDLSRQTQTSAA